MSTIRLIYKILGWITFFNIIFGKRGNKGKRIAKHVVRKQSHKSLAKLLR